MLVYRTHKSVKGKLQLVRFSTIFMNVARKKSPRWLFEEACRQLCWTSPFTSQTNKQQQQQQQQQQHRSALVKLHEPGHVVIHKLSGCVGTTLELCKCVSVIASPYTGMA